jgi:hypothetical protein
MSVEFRFYCPHCEFKNCFELSSNEEILCTNCSKKVLNSGFSVEPATSENKCLLCEGDHFYLVKDFNRMIGILIFLAGAILSIWTYGISLAVAALIDAILYKKLPLLKVCYVCDSEYRGVPILKTDKGFEHTMGDLIRPSREDWQIGKREQFGQVDSR